MKSTKRFLAFLLSLALVLSVFTVTSKSTATEVTSTTPDTITVTIRVEDAYKTLVPATQITLTKEDVASLNTTFNAGESAVLDTENTTAAHALAKYVSQNSKTPTSDLTFSFKNPSYIVGQEELSLPDSSNFWSFRVNNTSPVMSDNITQYNFTECPIQNGDSIVVFRQNYNNVTGASTSYLFFEQDNFLINISDSFNLNLQKETFDSSWNTVYVPAAETFSVEQDGTPILSGQTSSNGESIINISKAGTYTLTAGTYPETSRAVATLVLNDPSAEPTAAPTASPSATPAVSPTPTSTPMIIAPAPTIPAASTSVKKPAAPKKVTAKVKKSKVSYKKVTFSWKKVSSATGYEVYVSKKKGKKFSKLATTKKNSVTKKLKKGNYTVKVRSYTKSGNKKSYSSYSKITSFRVK